MITRPMPRPWLWSQWSQSLDKRRISKDRGPPAHLLPERLAYFSVPEPNSGCLLWLGHSNQEGYGLLWARDTTVLAHRLSWELANGPIPEGLLCLHKCDVPSCINPAHLFLGSNKDNMADRRRKGRYRNKRGTDHPLRKLSEDQAREIKFSLGRASDLSKRFNIDRSIVWRIRTGKLWSHLQKEATP